MLYLTLSLEAWRTPDFESVLIAELAALDVKHFPLQQGLKHSSHALSKDMTLMFIEAGDHPGVVKARIGIHYQGVIAGCACADDPTPPDTLCEYCEIGVSIDKGTARAVLELLDS